MAQHRAAILPIFAALLLSHIIFTHGKLECEELPVEDCAFSVSSSGARCVLEKYRGEDETTHLECQSSIIMAEKQEEWIESDECVRSCGLERISFGLSTDLLLDSHFTEMLCSPECLNNCPNIIDLYISLAAGEGLYLPQVCKTHRMSSRRLIVDPVKKAIDAVYLRSLYAPSLTSGGALAPGGNPLPHSGASGYSRGGVAGGSGTGYAGLGSGPTPAPSGAPEIQKGSGPSSPGGVWNTQSAGPVSGPYQWGAGEPSPAEAPSSPPWVPSGQPDSSPLSSPSTGAVFGTASAPSPSTSSPLLSPAPLIVESAPPPLAETVAPLKPTSDRQLDDEELLYEAYFN